MATKKKASKVKRDVGRPTKYDPKYCDEIVQAMSDGSSLVAFAHKIGVVDSTLYEWKKKYPEFSRAIKRAMHASQSWWETQGRDGLFMDKMQSFSSSVWIFNMKARFGYRDKIDVELDQRVTPAFDTSKMSKEEYMEFATKLHKKRTEDK